MSARGILLETPGSRSEPMHWPLRDGERKLLTVGTNADWSITGGSLLPVHATLYFDGESLCVAAAPGALLNGEPLGHEWFPLSLPAQLSLGDTNISLAPSDPPPSEPTTSVRPPSVAPPRAPSVPPPRAPSVPPPPRAPSVPPPSVPPPSVPPPSARELSAHDAWLQRTTIMDLPHLEEFREASRAAARVEAREATVPPREADRVTPTGLFQSPSFDPDATQLALPTLGHPVPAPPAQPPTAAPANAPPSLSKQVSARSRFAQSFGAASWPKKLTLALLPVVFGLLVLKSVRDRQGPPRASSAPRSSAARLAPGNSAPSVSAPPSAPAPAPASPASDGRSAGLTLQRRAVDAFATGNFQEAARLYRRLSEESPRDAAFAVAARLAKERASGVNHD